MRSDTSLQRRAGAQLPLCGCAQIRLRRTSHSCALGEINFKFSIMNFSQEFFSKDYFFGMKNSNYMNYNHYDNDRFWSSIILKIKKHKMGGKVLDAGCAFGFLLKRLQNDFVELHGIDISEYAVERAKKEIPSAKIQRVNMDTDSLPYPDEYFDLITALDVLEHTNSIEKNLNIISAKIKKGGYLIITVPIKDSWAGKIFRFFDKDSSHVSVLSRKEIFKMIGNSNLKILEKNYFLNSVFFKIKHIPVDVELLLQKE